MRLESLLTWRWCFSKSQSENKCLLYQLKVRPCGTNSPSSGRCLPQSHSALEKYTAGLQISFGNITSANIDEDADH